MKKCSKCKEHKSLDNFKRNRCRKDGYNGQCKACVKQYAKDNPDIIKAQHQRYHEKYKETQNARAKEYAKRHYQENKTYYITKDAKRRATELQAIPCWFESELVASIYTKATELGFEVDHIVPLNNPLVCGLHCWNNLQLLSPELNRSKGNRHWPDMP